MFQVEDARPYAETIDGRDLIIPVEKYGIKLLSIGLEKLGHPQPESNLSVEINKGSPVVIST